MSATEGDWGAWAGVALDEDPEGPMRQAVRKAIADHARLKIDVATLDDDADLFAAGMTSRAVVTVMLAIEESLEVELPETLLKKDTFRSIASICMALEQADPRSGW